MCCAPSKSTLPPCVLRGALVRCDDDALAGAATDWWQILQLYDQLFILGRVAHDDSSQRGKCP